MTDEETARAVARQLLLVKGARVVVREGAELVNGKILQEDALGTIALERVGESGICAVRFGGPVRFVYIKDVEYVG